MNKLFLKNFIGCLVLISLSCCESPTINSNSSEKTDLPAINEPSEQKSLESQTFPERKNAVERTIDTLMLNCRQKNYEVVAASMIYAGENDSRKWKDVYHVKNGTDYDIVRITADVIAGWVKEADTYTFGRQSKIDHVSGNWDEQEVIFMSKENIHRKKFSFLLKNGKYFLTGVKSQQEES